MVVGARNVVEKKQTKVLADKKGFNIEKYYEENEDCIYVKYRYVDNTENTDIDDGNPNLNPIDTQ